LSNAVPSSEGNKADADPTISAMGSQLDASPGGPNDHRHLFDYFSNAIASGALRVSDRLPSERQLMNSFGATRNTVRKALVALERAGLVIRKRGSGTYASTGQAHRPAALEASKIGPLDVMEIRLILEPGFVDLIIARATPNDFDRMERCLDRADRASSQQEFREAALAFRLEAAKATRNPLIVQIYDFLMNARKEAGWHRLRKVDESKEAQRKRTQRNRAFLAALRDRNKPLAKQLIRARLSLMVAEVTGATLEDQAEPADPTADLEGATEGHWGEP
jgi:DNA-binding FadR family transcriptional regulator